MSTLTHILDLAALPADAIPPSARAMARFSLFDWMVCGRAGRGEPLAAILRDFAAAEGGKPVASVIGGGQSSVRAAALVNGATSHALDYDDTHFGHVGHPSVAIYPAALAAAEMTGAPGAAVADAFLLGAEASVRIGMVLGTIHYNRGFHQTATAGAFGATIAAGRILGLSRAEMQAALGLCATRASGLKSQFGTMGKPYNAGIAASNGVECALLARAGLTSADDGLMGAQGFVPTHSDAPDEARGAWGNPPPGTFLFEDIKYKLHACCHGTHAMIEALTIIREDAGVKADQIVEIRLATNPRWLSVCDIKAPRTGLEAKFSYAWLAGMVFRQIPTSNDRTYTDLLANDPGLADFATKVRVTGDSDVGDMQAIGEVVLIDGKILPFSYDLSARLPAIDIERRLRAKARELIGSEAESIWNAVAELDNQSAAELGSILRKS
jgi:2-methylcitrate dehydratase PrpD